MQYYHVTTPNYEPGDDLYCWQEAESRGIVGPDDWKWDSDGIDTDVVCLFTSLAEAREFVATFAQDGVILSIEIPEDAGISMVTVEEGYPAVVGRIPARYIQGTVG